MRLYTTTLADLEPKLDGRGILCEPLRMVQGLDANIYVANIDDSKIVKPKDLINTEYVKNLLEEHKEIASNIRSMFRKEAVSSWILYLIGKHFYEDNPGVLLMKARRDVLKWVSEAAKEVGATAIDVTTICNDKDSWYVIEEVKWEKWS